MVGETQVLRAPAPRSWRVRWLWAGVVAVVVAGVAVAVAVVLSPVLPLGTVGSGIAAAASGADAGRADLAKAIEDGTALAGATTANQLADPTAYSELLGALATARAALDGTPQEVAAARTAVGAAIDRVGRSLQAKALADARVELSAVIGTAVQVDADSAGRMPDDAVRAELQARVSAGQALLASATATIDAVIQQVQAITDQTAAVLAARVMGFRDADGQWCSASGSSCLVIAWPGATLADGGTIELAGGDAAVAGSGCYETDAFGRGRDLAALLYCPAGEPVPSSRRVSGGDSGEIDRDRLWMSSGDRLTDLRYRA